MLQDFKLAFRTLLKSPEYSVIALLTLALGIGTTTAMYNLVDALLFRSAPFPESQRLVQVIGTSPGNQYEQFSEVDLPEIRTQATSLTESFAMTYAASALSEPGVPAKRVSGIAAGAELFSVLRVSPALGRAFTPDECQRGAGKVVILTHSYWQSAYGGSPTVIGKLLRIDGEPTTVIGVMPPTFEYRMLWGPCNFLRPLVFTPDQVGQRDYRIFSLIGRLAPGAPPQKVAAELAPLSARMAKELPGTYANRGYRVPALQDAVMDDLGRTMVWMMLVLSGFVLLIACANLANLQLARAMTNVRDLAIRSALGASRFHLIRQQLAECILIAIGGGAFGLVIAMWIDDALQQQIMIGDSPGLDLRMSVSTLTATALISIASGVIFGIVPAWLASKTDVNAMLKTQARGSTTSKSHRWLRNALIVAEICMALVLISGATVMVHGFNSLLNKSGGWASDKVLTANVLMPETRYATPEKRIEFYRAVQTRLQALPGVTGVALATGTPVFTYGNTRNIIAEGEAPVPTGGAQPKAFHVNVTPSYFETMEIKLVDGRLFTDDIKTDGVPVIIINESLAKHLWPGKSPIGKRIGSMEAKGTIYREVIGVVKDVQFVANPSKPETEFQLYRPLVQEPWSFVNIILKSDQPLAHVAALRRAVNEIDSDLPAENIQTTNQTVEQILHNILLIGKTLTGFSILGLVLASVGLYGVISGTVAQRTSEFGIRLALGASPRDVLALVLRHGVKLAVSGIVIGIGGSFVIARFLGTQFTRIGTLDAGTLLVLSFALWLVTMFATWLPARRATRVDPLIALRAE